jgi:hypothetical protein
MLSFDMMIRERVNMPITWESAAEDWVLELNEMSPDSELMDIERVKSVRDKMFSSKNNHPELWANIAGEAISELRERSEWSVERMTSLLINKQRDYGHQNILQGGLFGVAIRLSDKIERYANLERKASTDGPRNESVIDTLLDMVGYCVIALMLSDGSFILDLAD